MAAEMVRRAMEIPPYPDGVRRSRAAIVRNTLQQIKSTCVVTWREWFAHITHYKVSDQTLQIRFGLDDGTRVELDILLLPLDTPDNVDRLLSLELTFVWVSEFREVPLELVQAAFSRCGRFPSRINVKEYWFGLWAESNSFSIDSDYYEFLELDKPPGVGYWVQPGAREQNAENLEHIAPNYYQNLIELNSEAWVASYVDNKLMPSLSGQAVFSQTFDREYHVAKQELSPIWGAHLIIGMDTGRNPAAVIGQMDPTGRLLVLHAMYAENMGIQKFIDERLRPTLAQRFPAQMMFACVDPAARQRSQIGEKSVLQAILEAGINAVPASTNNIDPRIRAVEEFLIRRNGLLMCPVHCQDLILAMQYHYRYKRNKTTKNLDEVPDKTHPWSDLADSLQYMCLGTESRVMAQQLRRATAPRDYAPEPTKHVW